jgi:hypothetical protein
MTRSSALDRLAQHRAEEITAWDALDFELLSPSELFLQAREFGYRGLVVQELTTVDDRDACEIVDGWNDSLGGSDVYRRPEALELGVGFGFVGESALTVIEVGVPQPADPDKKRWPGVAPREYALDDLFRDVNRKRVGLGLKSFDRSEELDAEAQRLADELLVDPSRRYDGVLAVPEGHALYLKGDGWQVGVDRRAIDLWFSKQRPIVVAPGTPAAGVGLASRGRDGRLEAVWVLLVAKPDR